MISRAISDKYARALFKISSEMGAVYESARELKFIVSQLYDGRTFALLDRAQYKHGISATIYGIINQLGYSELISRFVSIVVENRRFELLAEIERSFAGLVRERNGVLLVKLISSHKMRSEAIDAVKTALRKKYAHDSSVIEIEIDSVINRSILGGLQIRIGSMMIDASLRSRLEKLKRELISAASAV